MLRLGVKNLLNRNCRLKQEDITYIFDFAEVDSIIVDHEFVSLLDGYKKTHPQVPLIIDNVSEDQLMSGDDSLFSLGDKRIREISPI